MDAQANRTRFSEDVRVQRHAGDVEWAGEDEEPDDGDNIGREGQYAVW